MLCSLVAASLSYDHLAAQQRSQRYDVLQNANQKEVDSDYTEIPESSPKEAEYAYPEVTPSKTGVEEHFYEAIPLDKKKSKISKNKEPSPYMEVTHTQPKLSGTKIPPRPTYKPNERSNDRLQGLNDLMASLEDIKVSFLLDYVHTSNKFNLIYTLSQLRPVNFNRLTPLSLLVLLTLSRISTLTSHSWTLYSYLLTITCRTS